ncbi:TetR/AcrR family transcriptional regulator [Streptomyces sp. NPDC001414]
MCHSRAQRAASREGVLRIAARKVRTDGISGIGIADLMREARLTHGGFYKHFASRDDLSPQAAAALAEGSAKMSGPRGRTTRTRGPASSTRTSPSSTRHTRHRLRTGPPGLGRGGDGTEGDLHLEEAYERQVRAYLDLIAGLDRADADADADADARAVAVLTLSALVGAVLMSRAVADEGLSDELLERVDAQLKRRGRPLTRPPLTRPRGSAHFVRVRRAEAGLPAAFMTDATVPLAVPGRRPWPAGARWCSPGWSWCSAATRRAMSYRHPPCCSPRTHS